MNPGPRFQCGLCKKYCKASDRLLECEECGKRFHALQAQTLVTTNSFKRIVSCDGAWYCTNCKADCGLSGEVLNKLKSRGFRATSLSTYDFSTLYTTLPHNLIKEKLINLIEWTFKREGSPYIACNERQAFFTSEDTKRYKLWSCQNVCEALIYLLDNIYIRFGTKLYRQIVDIPMGTNCAPLVADLFLFLL